MKDYRVRTCVQMFCTHLIVRSTATSLITAALLMVELTKAGNRQTAVRFKEDCVCDKHHS